ncbi:MAG: nitroreductase family protein [Chromatiales bacterium]
MKAEVDRRKGERSVMKKPIDTAQPVHELIAERWSGRAYDPQRQVPRPHLFALLEAARWAPSCFGDEPWRYLIWERQRNAASWQRAFDCLAEGNRSWAQHAPLLMLSTADGTFVKSGKPNRWGQHDTGAASVSLCLQAAALGLMVHQMGGFDAERVRQEFSIPERYAPMAMITVGYQLPADRIPESMREREYAPRARRPLAASFFEGAWGTAVAFQ